MKTKSYITKGKIITAYIDKDETFVVIRTPSGKINTYSTRTNEKVRGRCYA